MCVLLRPFIATYHIASLDEVNVCDSAALTTLRANQECVCCVCLLELDSFFSICLCHTALENPHCWHRIDMMMFFLFSSLRRWLHQVNCVNVMIFQFNLKRPTAKQRSATTVLGVSCVWTRQWGGNLLLLQLL